MKANVGRFDRILRIAVGVVLLAAVVILEGNARWLGLIGLISFFGHSRTASA